MKRIFYISEIEESSSFHNKTMEIVDKILILSFDAKNSDVENGIFGFDRFDRKFEKICTSNLISLINEYRPIQVFTETYHPVWVSMRINQTITLELDILRKSNYKLFNEIKFDNNPNFTFEPINLKDSKVVNITCNRTNASPTQILVKADGETVGAINFFHCEPRRLALDWRFVEINGNLTGTRADFSILGNRITIETLRNLLRKSFNPILIDIIIENETPSISNLSNYREYFERAKIILKNDKENYFYINDNRKGSFVGYIQLNSIASATALTLYFINRRCIKPSEVSNSENGDSYNLTGGFSPIGTGIAYMVLDGNNRFLDENTIHELLHAVCLEHPFDARSLHRFTATKTRNYMDYANTKVSTYYWQWRLIHEWINNNNQFTR